MIPYFLSCIPFDPAFFSKGGICMMIGHCLHQVVCDAILSKKNTPTSIPLVCYVRTESNGVAEPTTSVFFFFLSKAQVLEVNLKE